MAGTIDPMAFKDVMIVLGTAGVVVPLVHRVKLSPVLGFLAAGLLVGPSGLGAWAPDVPGLEYVTVTDRAQIALLAELGVVILLFVIGLELSLDRLRKLRRLVFGLGTAQLGLSAVALALVGLALGLNVGAALLVGAALAMSSTAIVVELLARQRRLSTQAGRTALAVLILQDLAFIPLLFTVDTVDAPADANLWMVAGIALAKAAAAIGAVVVIGRTLLPRLLKMAARTDSAELFMAATLLVVMATGIVTVAAGLSMALGAFVAGLMLSETEYRRAIEATIEPFKGLLLGVFFLSVGMLIDLRLVAEQPFTLLGLAVAVVAIKAMIVLPLMRGFGISQPTAVQSGLLLSTCGEFAFVLLAAGVAARVLTPELAGLLLLVVVLTMVATPVLDWLGRRLVHRAERRALSDAMASEERPEEVPHRAVVIGYGRVGQLVCSLLDEHGVSHVAIERDTTVVSTSRRQGRPVYFGDVTNQAFLAHSGIHDAQAVIITIQAIEAIDDIVRAVLKFRPDAVIVARAHDSAHAQHLYRLGVTDAVPETIEASLQLSEAALVGLGVPAGPVIASIHERRDLYRRALMDAARSNRLGFGRLRRDAALAAPTRREEG